MNTLKSDVKRTKRRIFRVFYVAIFLGVFLSPILYAEGDMMKGTTISGGMMNRYEYIQVDPGVLMQHMSTKDFSLINVHVPYGGEIQGTDANLPYNRIDEIVALYPDKDNTLVLYCRSGSMSSTASKELAKLGYTQIIELKGGYNAWERAGGEMMIR